MIGDRACDCDPLHQCLRQKYGIRLIALHKYNRRRKRNPDGRELHRYCRWKHHEVNFLGMLVPGCRVIIWKH